MPRASLSKPWRPSLGKALLAVMLLGASPAHAASPVHAASPLLVASAQAPARHCAKLDLASLGALRRGETRMVVVVKAFEPPAPFNAPLVLTLLSDAGRQRHPLMQFAPHPLRAFNAQQRERQQRFAVSLAAHASFIADAQALCVELGFAHSPAPLLQGRAEFTLEFPAPPR